MMASWFSAETRRPLGGSRVINDCVNGYLV